MTSEQLQSARAERWRQTTNPIVTADDAREWVEEIGLCLFLPRRAYFSAPAPSFVEAVAGAPSDSTPANKDHSPGTPDAPSREAIENATALLRRLTAEGAVVPLNLLHAGAFGSGAAAPVIGGVDQPYFLATRETLPYVFSLIGGRNWKSGPGDKASPLMKEIWTLLNGEGPLTAQEIQRTLGRELTEAAVLRGLVELWGGLRAIPVYDDDTTRWELTQARFAAEMTASQKVAQTTALSALVSLYLQSVIAASSEEVETFLSPLASRSRVREVVNGLQATRQLGLVSVNAQPLVHVAGALPEFAEAEPEMAERKPPSFEKREAFDKRKAIAERGTRGETRRTFERGPREETRKPHFERREERGERRPYARPGEGRERAQHRPFNKERRPEGAERGPSQRPIRKPFDKERRAEGGDRERFGKKRFDSGSRGFERARPFDRERGGERGAERRGSSEFRGGGKFPPKKFDKVGGERRGQARGEGPWPARGERRGSEKPAARREEGGRKFGERDRDRGSERGRRADAHGGERRPGMFGGGKKFGGKKFAGEKRFGGPKKFVSRGPAKEFEGEKRPFRSEGGGERGDKRGAERVSRPESRSGVRFEQRGARGPKQGKPEFRGSGKPAFGGKKFGERGTGKSGFKRSGFGGSAKPFGKSGKKFGKTPQSGGKQHTGPRPGGFKPPFRKRKDRENETGE